MRTQSLQSAICSGPPQLCVPQKSRQSRIHTMPTVRYICTLLWGASIHWRWCNCNWTVCVFARNLTWNLFGICQQINASVPSPRNTTQTVARMLIHKLTITITINNGIKYTKHAHSTPTHTHAHQSGRPHTRIQSITAPPGAHPKTFRVVYEQKRTHHHALGCCRIRSQHELYGFTINHCWANTSAIEHTCEHIARHVLLGPSLTLTCMSAV